MRGLSLRLAALIPPAAALISASSSAAAMPLACADRERILERLASDYAESVVVRGLTHDGRLLEVTAAPNGETWSLVLTAPGGQACLVTAGEAWQPAIRQPGPAM